MENTEDHQEELGGSVLFETYLAAKKALSAKIKEIIEIMGQCKVLDVDPPEAIQFVCSKPGEVIILCCLAPLFRPLWISYVPIQI